MFIREKKKKDEQTLQFSKSESVFHILQGHFIGRAVDLVLLSLSRFSRDIREDNCPCLGMLRKSGAHLGELRRYCRIRTDVM